MLTKRRMQPSCAWLRLQLRRRLPILGWLRGYSAGDALCDAMAGFTVGLTLIPQAIAYAALAGLSPQYGLYSAFAGSFVYIFFGTCREVNIGPTALLSLLTSTYTHDTSPDLAVLLCFLAGCVELLCGLLQLGFLVEFVSVPVVTGFTSAAALIIACSQVKGLLGLSIKGHNFADTVVAVFENIGSTRLWDAILSLFCITALLTLRKLKDLKFKDTSSLTVRIISKFIWCISTWRNAVIVIISTAVAYYVSENEKIPFILTGRIEPGLPTVTPPPFSTSFDNKTLSFGDMCSYLGSGLAVVPIVAILGNVAIAKAFSNGEMLDATQEMITLGLCNIVGSFFRSMPVNGSFSRSAVNNSSGVRTQMGGLYTGILVIMALSLLTPHFYYIPKATLSSVIICAVIFMIEVDILPSLWRSNKRDLIPLFVTFIACLWLGVEIGIVIGIAVDIAILLYFNARPRVTVEKLKCPPAGPEYLLVRPGAGLLFPAVDFLRDAVAKASANCAEENLPVVIDCQHVQHADFTAARGIRALAADLSRRGHHCVFHRLRPDVSDVLGVTDTQCSSTEEELHTILQGLYDADATVLQIKDPDNSSSQATLVSNHNTTKL
ncbi:sodium-independent sulfate anion transporter-like [Schistocerca nitens]|uniref:sodium-independent sulfate anion transporter-like n=1 Tax=Schistocerca nitens TaxID=7011 RepID=UPI00211758FB|nr:sodium-independent sulfate anion transporter-like [Schistocerca nitens]XP_049799027.1 sodium-independent sulfate anion transporter-like [Schistocerca nitens]